MDSSAEKFETRKQHNEIHEDDPEVGQVRAHADSSSSSVAGKHEVVEGEEESINYKTLTWWYVSASRTPNHYKQ